MSNIEQQIDNLKTLQESYDSLAAASDAYNTGKVELAANITAKGVEASASETLPELAAKVGQIVQTQEVIDGGEMYAEQLYGSPSNDVTPGFWNPYEVMTQLLSDGRLVSYGGILLAEYYRGYDSLALAGAGSGGAYVVSDKDDEGNFIMYTENTTHTWDTEFDGKCNRWVAYCFAGEYHDFQITDTNTSPRSILIGRKVGTITCLVNTRISSISILDGSVLSSFNMGGHTANWGQSVIIKGIKNMPYIITNSVLEKLYLKSEKITGTAISNNDSLCSMVLECDEIYSTRDINLVPSSTKLAFIIIKGVGSMTGNLYLNRYADNINYGDWNNLKEMLFLDTEELNLMAGADSEYNYPNLTRYYISYKDNNKNKTIFIRGNSHTPANDIEVKSGWCKPLYVAGCNRLTESNMYSHILQRLKQDEPNCGSGVTITLGSTNLNKLISQESQDLLAELRGTYGYTFA